MFRNRLLTLAILAAICILASVITVFGGFVVDVVSSYGKEQKEVAPANYPRLAQNLQTDLNSALAPEFPFNFDAAGNPFADKTGVSFAVNDKGGITPVINGGGSTMIVPPKNPFPNGNQQVMPVQNFNQPLNPNSQPVISGTNTNPFETLQPSEDSTKLLAERNRKIRQGMEVGDLSDIYSINDVRPIGVIGSGNKNKVWLYSPTTKQRFSVRKGTKFRDGTIEGITSEGIQFRRNDGSIANTRWMKNKEMSQDDENSPILRVDSPNNQIIQPLPSNSPTQTVRVQKKKSN